MKIYEAKKVICRNLERMVKKTYGKSTPVIFHQPKIPMSLKKK